MNIKYNKWNIVFLTSALLFWSYVANADRFEHDHHHNGHFEQGDNREHFEHQEVHVHGRDIEQEDRAMQHGHEHGEYNRHIEQGRRYYHNGHHYNYFHNGDYYNYFHDGAYYNYFYNGAYYLYFINGAYYNYFYKGSYYKTCREIPGHREQGRWYPPAMICH